MNSKWAEPVVFYVISSAAGYSEEQYKRIGSYYQLVYREYVFTNTILKHQ
jgi:hypothetical protein